MLNPYCDNLYSRSFREPLKRKIALHPSELMAYSIIHCLLWEEQNCTIGIPFNYWSTRITKM